MASIGGDLIKDLVEVEATVHYGYTLIPQTLQPGVMLGIEARAKLLAGLLGLSFGARRDGAPAESLIDERRSRSGPSLRVAAACRWRCSSRSARFSDAVRAEAAAWAVALAANVNPLIAVR